MNNPVYAISDFLFIEQLPETADIILVPGGSSPELMLRAIELWQEGWAPVILPSGGPNPRIGDFATEWAWFASMAGDAGVPESAILREDRAANTFENARFSRQRILEQGMEVGKAILVTKAFHARRALMTYQAEFSSEIEYIVCPITDRRKITRDNWAKDQEKIDKVMNELEKIGSYFPAHLSRMQATGEWG